MIIESKQSDEQEIEKYVRAVESSLLKVPIRQGNHVYLSDIWLVTSLPKDLIVEIIKKYQIELPENVKTIIDGKKVIKRR
ncbi:MAG TPA: hypothetical protein ENF81_10505 [Thermotogaceae bacterium]|nr:hypothetical protein [Thermotogota bacterium]HEW92950.1 hypothetical protein [Thermotogaceae bacterium]